MSEFSVKEYKKIYLSQVTLKHYKVWYKKKHMYIHTVLYTPIDYLICSSASWIEL